MRHGDELVTPDPVPQLVNLESLNILLSIGCDLGEEIGGSRLIIRSFTVFDTTASAGPQQPGISMMIGVRLSHP
jgi:hypothetical protein